MRDAALGTLLILVSTSGLADSLDDVSIEVDSGEQLWNRAGPASYEIEVHFNSFILPKGCSTQRFRVSNGQSVALTRPICKSREFKADSIPALFLFIRKNLRSAKTQRGGANEARLDIDPTIGYPKSFSIDIKDMEDAFVDFEVVTFKRE